MNWILSFFSSTPIVWQVAFYICLVITSAVFVFAPRNASNQDAPSTDVRIAVDNSVTNVNSNNPQHQFIDKYYAAQQPQEPKYEIVKGSRTDRNYLLKTPPELWADIERLNPIQTKAFVEREYEGRWIAIKAPILSLYQSDDLGSIDFGSTALKTRFIFTDVSQIEKLKGLYRGRQVTVEGKFKVILDDIVSFEDGEVLEP